MNQERWQQIKSTVALAMETPETERGSLIDSACGSDTELRHEVESLLAAAAAADSMPEARAAIANATSSLAANEDASLRALLDSVLSHQYEIIRPLGRGGMGWVYLARERALERFVAIKVLRPELAMAEGHRERFRREARIAARLTHPGILGLHSFGEIGNLWYFVMTYVRGETLAEKVRREGFLPWTDAHRILTEMADALDCAHRNGVVHRDIKPANILLDSDSGHAILADFGISKMFGSTEHLTATGAVMGTPAYMSPEQVMGTSDIDERADIYSLGAVAYVMLTGREPFKAESAAATAYRRLVEDAIPPELIVSSIPPDLSAVVRKCMARERTERWANAKALKEALENILAADRLPSVTRDLRSFGPYALLWVIGWAGFAFIAPSANQRTLLTLVALIAPIGLVLHLWNGAGRGIRFTELARIALWPPEWWSMWWPRALRRQSDLWNRLPFVAKAVRIGISASLPALLLLILIRGKLSADMNVFFESWVETAEWAIILAGWFVVALGFVWAKRTGFTLHQSVRLLLGPTLTSPGWKDPALMRLLSPASGKVRAPVGDKPSDYLRAIRELAPHLENHGLHVTAAAESVLLAIDQCDSELAELARDAGPDEANRLSTQLEALESGGAGDTQERKELRDLVRHQLDLVRRMQGRREIVQRQRSHLVDLLKALWGAIRDVGESRDGGPDGAQRIDALCGEIRRDLERSVPVS
jgi:serine/threonine-protein kinase